MAIGIPLIQRILEDFKNGDARQLKLFLQNLYEKVKGIEENVNVKINNVPSLEPTKNTIALRDVEGQLKAQDPTEDDDVVTKGYADDNYSAGTSADVEAAQDAVGLMVSGNTEDGLTVTYDDTNGKLNFTNTDKGSSQNIFKTIAVSGESNVVADSNNDTLTLVAGDALTITTDASTDTITISGGTTAGRQTYGTPTGTLTRTTFATYAGQTVSNPPTQAEVQAIDNHVKILSERLAAVINDLEQHGLFL